MKILNTQELRVGNWMITDNDDDVNNEYQVRTIYGLEAFGSHGYVIVAPIPISVSWAKKLGFTIFKESILKWAYVELLEGLLLQICITTGDVTIEDAVHGLEITTLPTKVEYVHQLQNLYFSLTGEELEIKTHIT